MSEESDANAIISVRRGLASRDNALTIAAAQIVSLERRLAESERERILWFETASEMREALEKAEERIAELQQALLLAKRTLILDASTESVHAVIAAALEEK